MLTSSALIALIAVVIVGSLVLWSNPSRPVNRVVFSSSLHIALWLGMLYLAVSSADGLYWLRWTTAIAALTPLHFWIVKEVIAHDPEKMSVGFGRRIAGWLVITVVLAVICFTEFFIPSHSTAAKRIYGFGYSFYIVGILGLFVALGIDTLRRIRALTGVRRSELQVWLGGGCATAATILLLMALGAAMHNSRYIKLQPLVVMGFYTVTVVVITTRRIFDARQLMLVGLQKLALVGLVAGAAYLSDAIIGLVLLEPFAFLLTVAVTLWFSVLLNNWLDELLNFYPQAGKVRAAAHAAAQRELRMERLEESFLKLLKGWGQCERAVILAGNREGVRGGGLDLAGDGAEMRELRDLGWATPERLLRERSTPGREALAGFLARHGLAALTISEGPTLTVLLGVGVAASRQPFTYPQVELLMEIGSIAESAMERALFAAKAQRAEQLATVGLLGASLAHEIRNPLVSIKAFVHMLPKHYHDAAFRDKFFTLIGGEVRRIDQLTEQLLDLSTPRTYLPKLTELHPVLRAGIELAQAKANNQAIRFLAEFTATSDLAFTDAAAVKQVLLNLCFNAIQAIESQTGDRWVKVSTRLTAGGLEVTVEDNGPGILPEMRPKLFQPFQTSKSRGFGLGLAICGDILAGLNATITVDPSNTGRGAVFRVTYPCQPFSS